MTIAPALLQLQRQLAALPAPIIVYNKSHSGSRLLARALIEQGVFMGAERNLSEDALPILAIVEAVVTDHYPDFTTLWRARGAGPDRLAALAGEAFRRHLAGYRAADGRPWGWKLCETLYALPFFDLLFPEARVVHLVRDGRDVAWCDHVAPELPFWRKVYFNSDRISSWRGHGLSNAAYVRRPHLYNALHWANSVELGRAFGSMLRERYAEVRYEELCTDFAGTLSSLLARLGIAPDPAAIARLAPEVRRDSIGRHRRQPWRARRAVLRLIEPTLLAFGYVASPTRSWADRTAPLKAWLRRR
jgi:Sulfotransferase family